MSTLPSVNQVNGKAATHVIVGTLLGLTWGASLRAWMALLALQLGDTPKVTWQGTIGGVLLPGAAVGTLIGRSVYAAKTSEQKRWRWVILSPFLLVLGPLVTQRNFISTLLAKGLGGGAIGVALAGSLGGYALSGYSPQWTRRVAALLALLFLIASIFPFFLTRPSSAVPSKAHEALTVLLFVLLMAQLIVGISTPSRAQSRRHTLLSKMFGLDPGTIRRHIHAYSK